MCVLCCVSANGEVEGGRGALLYNSLCNRGGRFVLRKGFFFLF